MSQEALFEDERSEIYFSLKCTIVSFIFVINSMLYRFSHPEARFNHELTAFLAVIIIFIPVVLEAKDHLRKGKFGMNELVFIAMAACCAQSQYMEAAVVGIIMCLHEVIEHWTPSGSTSFLKDALKLNEKEITKVISGKIEKVNVNAVAVGDVIRVLPGEVLAVDGEVISGKSTLDKASITGESLPVEISEGSNVLAGTVNLSGVIQVEVSAAINETEISKIDKIMQEARASKIVTVTLMEKFSAPYAFSVIFICFMVFYFTNNSDQAISLLIVSFPDALVMAAPLAMLAALTSCSRNGVLLKTPSSLLRVQDCRSILFDKTGTLTDGALNVKDTYSELDFQDVFQDYSIALTKLSNHPVSKAIARLNPIDEYIVEDFEEIHGLGITGTISGQTVHIGRYNWIAELDESLSLELPSHLSIVVVAINKKFAGFFKLEDKLKPEAEEAVSLLQNDRYQKIKIISGDLISRVQKIAQELKVNFKGECLPDDKINEINQEKNSSQVMFVGDGLNDAPAMAAADVSISMKKDSNELTAENADVILLRNNLLCVPYLKSLSKDTNKIINQNIACGLIFVVLGVFLAASGVLKPAHAAIFHLLDAVFIVFNSARLIKVSV